MIGVYYFGMAADSSKVKTTFAFLDKVLHLTTAAVKLDNLIWFHIHVCNKKVYMCVNCLYDLSILKTTRLG